VGGAVLSCTLNGMAQKNKPAFKRVCCCLKKQLLNFVFFVDHMLARNWIEFLELELVWRAFLVFVGRVEMTGICSRYEFDFVTHGSLLSVSMLV
jgi:hypothetical protein